MIPIPGFVILLLTFPGVIVHEWAHKIACQWFGVRVLKVSYFRFNPSLVGGEAGFVIHERPPSYIASLCISAAPLFVNTIVALLVVLVARQFHPAIGPEIPLEMALVWLGFSIAAHAFPSNQDMSNVTEQATYEHYLIGALSKFLYITMYALNALKAFWLDFIYAVLIVSLAYTPL